MAGMVGMEGREGTDGSRHVLPPVIAADTHAVGPSEPVPCGYRGRRCRGELHQLTLMVVDVAVDAVDSGRIDRSVADRVAAAGMADGEELVRLPHHLEGVEVLPAGPRAGEIPFWKHQWHEVIDDAQPPGPLPREPIRPEIVGAAAMVREEETAREDRIDLRSLRTLEVGRRAPGRAGG